MEELIVIIRGLVQAVHSGDLRQETLDALDNLLKEITTVAPADTQSTGKRKAVTSGDS